jgi:hypothetical protein
MPLTAEEQSRLRLAFHRTGLSVEELADEAGVNTSLVEMMLGFRVWSALALHPSSTRGSLLKRRYTKLLENAQFFGQATQDKGRDSGAGV